MRIFLDTEFIEDKHGIDLISAAFIREDGKELYLINRGCDWRRVLADDWLSRNVVPHLPPMGDPRWEYSSTMQHKIWEFCCHPIRYTYENRGGVGTYRVCHPTTPEFWADYCVSPTTKILLSDLTWKNAGEIQEGESLVGFDEFAQPSEGRSSRWRQWRRSVVQKVRHLWRPCYRLTFSDGTQVKCSEEHMWLVNPKYEAARWVATQDLEVNGPRTKSCVVKPVPVWDTDYSREGGYLATAFDGEGHLTQRDLALEGKTKTFQTRLGFAQRPNAMLEEVKKCLKEKGFAFNTLCRADGLENLTVGQRSDVFRLLGSIRPQRLLSQFDPDCMGSMDLSTVDLVSKEFEGEGLVVALTTTSGTFIAEGLASHNCGYDWVALCRLYGRMVNLPKGFPMYCNDFQQLIAGTGFKPEEPDTTHDALEGASMIGEKVALSLDQSASSAR